MGLLDGFTGPDGRDARQRLAIGLMGLTHRPNESLMNMWGGEIQQRQATKAEAEKTNKTAQYLRSLGTAQAMQAAAALEAGTIDAGTAYAEATKQAPVVDPWANAVEIDGKLVQPGPDGKPQVLFDGSTPEPGFRIASPQEEQIYGGPGQIGPDGRFYPIEAKTTAPYTPEGKLKADFDAGRIGPEEYKSGMARLAPKGTTLSVDPATGAITFSQGGVGNPTGEPMIGDVYNPGAVDGAVTLIDDIMANPNLGRITGPVEGGGGNDIDQLSAVQRAWYGELGLDAIDKTNQLQSKAWLAARAMLKGGGQITDYESKKAEGAVARLSRAKGEAQFKQALKDLRDAITEGKAKLEAANGSAVTPTVGSSGTLTPDDLKYLETP